MKRSAHLSSLHTENVLTNNFHDENDFSQAIDFSAKTLPHKSTFLSFNKKKEFSRILCSSNHLKLLKTKQIEIPQNEKNCEENLESWSETNKVENIPNSSDSLSNEEGASDEKYFSDSGSEYTPKLVSSSDSSLSDFQKETKNNNIVPKQQNSKELSKCAKRIPWLNTENKIIFKKDIWLKSIFDKDLNKFNSRNYMDVFRKEMRKIYPCIINVSDSKINNVSMRIYSRKCINNRCSRFYMFCYERQFDMSGTEIFSDEIVFKVRIKGELNHDGNDQRNSQLKGQNRDHIVQLLKKSYATKTQAVLRESVDLNLKEFGNLGDFVGLGVLNQCRIEALKIKAQIFQS